MEHNTSGAMDDRSWLICVSICVQLKEIEDKILEVLSSSEVNFPAVSFFSLA